MEALGIDLKLLIAQIVNFGIIFFLLKKFLYKPILKAISDREEKIKKGLEDLERTKQEKDNLSKILVEERKKAETEVREIIRGAEQKAEEERKRILAEAKKEGAAIVEEQEEQFAKKAKELGKGMEKRVAELAISVAERLLGEILEKPTKQHLTINKAISELKKVE